MNIRQKQKCSVSHSLQTLIFSTNTSSCTLASRAYYRTFSSPYNSNAIHCIRISCLILIDFNLHAYGLNLNILWSSLKIWTPPQKIANFGHPVYKSWLRPVIYCMFLPYSQTKNQNTDLKTYGNMNTQNITGK